MSFGASALLFLFSAVPIDWDRVASRDLALVSPSESELARPVSVKILLQDANLIARFEVRTPEIHAPARLSPGQYPYSFDVVEVFVSATGSERHVPYYEFEVGPRNEDLQIKITERADGRLRFSDPIQVNGFTHTVERTQEGWIATLTIPLLELGWDGDTAKIQGNAFGIYGVRPERSYWSLFSPPQDHPNFHRPQDFGLLL